MPPPGASACSSHPIGRSGIAPARAGRPHISTLAVTSDERPSRRSGRPMMRARTLAAYEGSRLLLGVAPELLAHRRQDLVRELGLPTGLEAVQQRRREHVHRNALADRGEHRPTALAGVAHAPA